MNENNKKFCKNCNRPLDFRGLLYENPKWFCSNNTCLMHGEGNWQ